MRTITKCRSCNSSDLTEFLNLGTQYTSDFREDDSYPPAYPIVGVICKKCMLVQLRDTTPSHEMYHDNYGFKSGVSDSIKNDLEANVAHCLRFISSPKSWLDIASNDGTLLSFVPYGTKKYGIDPITKYCQQADAYGEIVNDFFNPNYFKGIKFDVITSISCFYDMDDPNEFVSGVAKVLAKDGIWDIQQNYLLPTMQLNAVDNFCHEHLEYYTLLSMEPLLARHGLEVIDVYTSMVNGGSIRTIVAHKGDYPTQDSVEQQRTIELDAKLSTLEPYEKFATEVNQGLRDLQLLCKDLRKQGKSIAILAASTRGSTIWQAANIDARLVDYAVERNPEKVGKMFSAIGIPIISEQDARERHPDYMIVGPWFFADEIIDRESEYLASGGHLIIPLPRLTIV